MSEINSILKDVRLSKVYKVKQKFEKEKIDDVRGDLIKKLNAKSWGIKKNQRIAITAGSRGISHYELLLKTIVDFVKSKGAIPFIVPAMGSHGGASAYGQEKMLKNLGIDKKTMGCEIISSMEVVKIGYAHDNLPVYIDKNAYRGDGIIIFNRVKMHTSFRGKYESGLIKMISIGLGKRKGADAIHAERFEHMADNILACAKVSLEKLNIIGGVCTIENGYDEVADIFVLDKNEILQREPQILQKSKSLMPRIYLDDIDVLIVKEIGKNISGTGMDTNVIGRFHTKAASGGPNITKVGILDLSNESLGNANGVGLADFATKKLYNKINFDYTYLNALTSTEPNSIKLPMILDNDELVIKACAKTCGILDSNKIKLVIIENTKNLNELYMSKVAYGSVVEKNKVEIISNEKEISFDEEGNLII
nr:lactate racemase domain-containing protein [uncultured Terrisporobacter sp.]